MTVSDDNQNGVKDERIRLLEFQAEFLRRELSVVAKRHHDHIYSFVYTVSWPLRLLEQLSQTLTRAGRTSRDRLRMRQPAPPRVLLRAAADDATGGLVGAIAAGITAKTGRHYAGR